MRTWIRRNWLAFGVIAVACFVVGFTVTRPAWERNIGDDGPDTTVDFGQSTTIGGVRWELAPVTAPASARLESPPNSKLVTYLLRREKDGKPATIAGPFDGCATSVVDDGGRRWTTAGLTPMPLLRWSLDKHFTTFCGGNGPLLVAISVPKDAHITAVDVLLFPKTEGDQDKSASAGHIRTIVRFNTN
ncbi:MAG TPA: hypothetical protein VH496_21620 [Mycobacterium sp.]|jgi:hypothetical protein